jgi:hypothetical protein
MDGRHFEVWNVQIGAGLAEPGGKGTLNFATASGFDPENC